MVWTLQQNAGAAWPSSSLGEATERTAQGDETLTGAAASDQETFAWPDEVQAQANVPSRRANGNVAAVRDGLVPVAGADDVRLAAEDMSGVWSLRFGLFGCPDSEMRGGVAHLDEGLLVGGDNHFAYLGHWILQGSELTATLEITRHSDDQDRPTVFGSTESNYHLECVAEAITSDLFEGRIRRSGFPDARATMRRIAFRKS